LPEVSEILNSLGISSNSLLIPLALHEHFIDSNILEDMNKDVQGDWRKGEVEQFLQSLVDSKLLKNRGDGIFEILSTLT